ncbi:MAG TPA: ABC transporter ATP-binding protein [Acidobacteriota bacterium]|jgi:ABC-2 type transport system ATP-binding protein|nr:ABC transporter ATP-binding protein [Acidobacteriota bacterium]
MQPYLELDNLSVRLGSRLVLQNLRGTFSGRAIGLLGPNGAGKTTLLHTLLGFFEPSEGTARVFECDIRADLKRIRRQIGYMPESDAYIAGMTGIRFVRLMAELSGLPAAEAMERAHEVMFYVGLGEARYRKIGTYSQGMKQLVKLAQAIVHGPRLLFLDEPTNGLDPPARQRMIQLICDIRDAGDMRVILSSHLLRDVEECCEEVLILKAGRIAVYCNLEEERKANRKFLELETRGEAAGFLERASELGCEFAQNRGRKIKMVLPDHVEIRDLYLIAAEQQLQIRRLDYKRDSLQDIFLRAMESGHGGL